jgi:hypothetical protein
MSTLEDFKKLALDYFALEAAAKEAESLRSKQATMLKKAFNAYIQANKLPGQTTIRYQQRKFGYIPGTTSVIDPAGWLRLFREGNLTEAQFLEALSVGKDAARSSAGQDVVAGLEVARPTKGTEPKWSTAEVAPDSPEWELDAPGHVTVTADTKKKESAVILRGPRLTPNRPTRRLTSQ